MGVELDVLVVEPDVDGAGDEWQEPAEEDSGNSPQCRLHAVRRRCKGVQGKRAGDRGSVVSGARLGGLQALSVGPPACARRRTRARSSGEWSPARICSKMRSASAGLRLPESTAARRLAAAWRARIEVSTPSAWPVGCAARSWSASSAVRRPDATSLSSRRGSFQCPSRERRRRWSVDMLAHYQYRVS